MADGPAEGAPVGDEEVLLRRVTVSMADPETGEANSSAFITDHPDGVSTVVASMVSHEECLAGGKPGMGLVEITAVKARAAGMTVRRDPVDQAHVLLILPSGTRNERRAVAKAVAAASVPVKGRFPFKAPASP